MIPAGRLPKVGRTASAVSASRAQKQLVPKYKNFEFKPIKYSFELVEPLWIPAPFRRAWKKSEKYFLELLVLAGVNRGWLFGQYVLPANHRRLKAFLKSFDKQRNLIQRRINEE